MLGKKCEKLIIYAIFKLAKKGLDFKFLGCPIDPDDNTKYWCSTKVDPNGNHVVNQSEFGHCSRNCPIQFNDQHGTQVYQCHTLLQQGPCEPNHWLVLVANDFVTTHFADCKRRIYKEDEIHFNNSFYKIDSNTVCGESQILLLNLFGEGTYILTKPIN